MDWDPTAESKVEPASNGLTWATKHVAAAEATAVAVHWLPEELAKAEDVAVAVQVPALCTRVEVAVADAFAAHAAGGGMIGVGKLIGGMIGIGKLIGGTETGAGAVLLPVPADADVAWMARWWQSHCRLGARGLGRNAFIGSPGWLLAPTHAGVPCKQGNGWLGVVDSVANAAQGWRCNEAMNCCTGHLLN